MHAVVTTVTISPDAERPEDFLREQIVPRVAQAPGFVSGHWVRTGDHGTGIVVFESEENAQAAVNQFQPPPGVTIDSAEVGELVAQA